MVLVLVAGCAYPNTRASEAIENARLRFVDYDVAMVEVRRPEETRERWGGVQIESNERGYVYTDDLIVAVFMVLNEGIQFWLSNVTDHSLRLVWDEAAFLDLSGVATGVMHQGVRYAARNEPQTPTVIPADGTVEDAAYPVGKITYNDGWEHEPLVGPPVIGFYLADSASMAEDSVRVRDAREKVGQQMSLLLPIEVQGVVNEYTFVFEVLGVDVSEPMRSEEAIGRAVDTGAVR